MKNLLREYFAYSRLERNGIFILSFLCLVFFLIPKIITKNTQNTTTDFSQFSEEIKAFEKAMSPPANEEVTSRNIELFKFNPNTVTKTELLALGLSPKVISTFINYRSKGGKFFRKEDFKKIYGLSAQDYLRLENYIEINLPQKKFPQDAYEEKKNPKRIFETFDFDPNSVSPENLRRLGFSKRAANNLIKFRAKGGTFRHKKEVSKIYGVDEELYEKLFPHIVFEETSDEQLVANKNRPEAEMSNQNRNHADLKVSLDVNTATVEDWQKLKGIGPYFSKSIVNFREKLGGFHNLDQVGETYNLPDSTFQKIRPNLQLKILHKQLNLNSLTAEELAQHPYLKNKQAKVIVNYRQQHGPFSNLDDLKKIKILTPEMIDKIKPYLTIE